MPKNDSQHYRLEEMPPETPIPTTLLWDRSLSMSAKGLYFTIKTYMMIPDFKLTKRFLIDTSIEGEKKFNTIWKELITKGYLKQDKQRSIGSRQFTYEYKLLDEPDLE